ncbi:MAG: hypothetical protein WA628_26075 [Terriglobales bacterium]
MRTGYRPTNFGAPWLALCAAFALHIADETLTGFLKVYNPTVLALRQRWAWFPMPQFEFREWLMELIIACAILICMAPLAYAGTSGLRPPAWLFAGIMLLNGIGHTLFSILGRTVAGVTFPRPAPGFYSSPALLAAALWMIARLRSTARR